jgi:hypothetical protein
VSTPGRQALIEAMRLEQARIYATTQRELREAALAAAGIGPLTADTPQEIANRRAIAEGINSHEIARVVDLHERRARTAS